MTRRQIRYWFFRFHQNALGEEASIADAPPGFQAEWESHPHFGGWGNFSITWDLADDSVETIVPLRYSLEQQWNTEASKTARGLPTVEE